MTSRVEWRDDWLKPEAIDAGLKQSAIVAQAAMRRNFGSEGGGVDAAKTKKRGRNVYKASPPGSFPGIRTGFLSRAVSYWFPASRSGSRAPFVRVGLRAGLSNGEGAEIADYGAALELSDNPKMRRPWAMRSIHMEKARMGRAFARGMRQYLQGRN